MSTVAWHFQGSLWPAFTVCLLEGGREEMMFGYTIIRHSNLLTSAPFFFNVTKNQLPTLSWNLGFLS